MEEYYNLSFQYRIVLLTQYSNSLTNTGLKTKLKLGAESDCQIPIKLGSNNCTAMSTFTIHVFFFFFWTWQALRPAQNTITTRANETAALCHSPSKEWLACIAHTSEVFIFFAEAEGRVTVKNSHQLACHFTVVLVKVFFAHNQTLSRFFTETSWRLVSAVKTSLKNRAICVCAFNWTL